MFERTKSAAYAVKVLLGIVAVSVFIGLAYLKTFIENLFDGLHARTRALF